MSVLLLTMGPQLSITRVPTVIAIGSAGAVSFRAVGAVGNVAWSLVNSTLPAEWATSLDVVDGIASILTIAATTPGTYSVTVRAVDGSRQPVVHTSLVNVAPLAINITGSIPNWETLTPVTGSLAITGGSGVYVGLSVISGYLPDGVGASLSTSSIVFSGTPVDVGSGHVSLQVMDDLGGIGEVSLSWVVEEGFSYIDDFIAPQRCWSLKKLIRGYSGKAIRVRRSSDNAEADVGFNGNSLDVDGLLAHVGSGNGYVRTWYDQTGNDDLKQESNASQPMIVMSGAYLGNIETPGTAWVGMKSSLDSGGAVRTACFHGRIYKSGSGTTYTIYSCNYYTSERRGLAFYYDTRFNVGTPAFTWATSMGATSSLFNPKGSSIDISTSDHTITSRHWLTASAVDVNSVWVDGGQIVLGDINNFNASMSGTFSAGDFYFGSIPDVSACKISCRSLVIFSADVGAYQDEIEGLI